MANYEQRKQTRQIIIHCTATCPATLVTVRDIEQWHKERGFVGIGYHFVVARDGTVYPGRPIDTVGAHCKGHNSDSIGVAWIGGLSDSTGQPEDNRTEAQKLALRRFVAFLKGCYPTISEVWGHNHYNPAKVCPCFDANCELCSLVRS